MFMKVVNLARRGIRMKSVAWPSFSARSLFLLTIIFFMAFSVQKAEENVKPRLSFAYDTEDRLYRRFSPVGVFNFTSLLLSTEDNTLYIGAREVLFSLNLSDISRLELHRNFSWSTPERKREECGFKGKNLHTDCLNYIKILLRVNTTHLYVCGTHAFSPMCAHINTVDFSLVRSSTREIVTEDGRSHCPYNPEFKSTAIIADEQRNESYTAVESLAESLAARPVQEVGEDSDLVEERDPAGPSKQKEKMLLSSDEEEH